MNLTLIRHGSVEEKYLGCYNGHIDISLSLQGINDAKNKASQISLEDYDAIYCSDLKRAKQTANALGLQNIIYTKELREKSWGENEGKSFKEIGIGYVDFTQFIDALGGETREDFIARIKDFFYNFLPKQQKNNILIITHSGLIKTLLSLHEKISLEDAFSKELPYLSIMKLRLKI